MKITFEEDKDTGFKKIKGYEMYFSHGLFRSKSNKDVFDSIKRYNLSIAQKIRPEGFLNTVKSKVETYIEQHTAKNDLGQRVDNRRSKIGRERVEAARAIINMINNKNEERVFNLRQEYLKQFSNNDC